MGAAYATAVAGSAVASISVVNPQVVMIALVPVIFASMLSLFGMIVAVFISNGSMFHLLVHPLIDPVSHLVQYSSLSGFMHMSSGLTTGLASLAAGYAIGIVGDLGVRGLVKQPKLLVGFVLLLVFSEILGIFGLVMGIMGLP